MEKVCILMSVYGKDCPESLHKALCSLEEQTYKNIDIYIYKDGEVSKELDDTINIHLMNNKRIFVIHNASNKGLAISLNNLIDYILLHVADVKYFARMDSDDICRLDRIERQIKYMSDFNLHVCGSFCKEFGASYALNEKKVPIQHSDIINAAITHCPFIHPTVIFEASVFKQGVRYPTDTGFTEDMALWFLLIERKYKLGNIPEVLLDYRLNENTVKRRLGLNKGISEFKLRLNYMIKTREYSLRNFSFLLLRLPFHILPVSLVKLLYKYAR